jgi:hypothetical protein
MRKLFLLLLLSTATWTSVECLAFSQNSLHFGLAFFSENSIKKITQTKTGVGSTLGTTTYPVLLKYDFKLGNTFFFAPTLTYTPMQRSDAANSAKVTAWQLILPLGTNLASSKFDWYIGPGTLNRTIKGSGGTTVLNNGAGTATFSLPGRSVTSQVYTVNAGTSVSFGNSRLGLDAFVEGAMSDKRTYDLMLSYAYAIISK